MYVSCPVTIKRGGTRGVPLVVTCTFEKGGGQTLPSHESRAQGFLFRFGGGAVSLLALSFGCHELSCPTVFLSLLICCPHHCRVCHYFFLFSAPISIRVILFFFKEKEGVIAFLERIRKTYISRANEKKGGNREKNAALYRERDVDIDIGGLVWCSYVDLSVYLFMEAR